MSFFITRHIFLDRLHVHQGYDVLLFVFYFLYFLTFTIFSHPICYLEHPCKVSAVSTSKTGKHGHAKCNFTAIDIFTGKKYEDIIPSTHTAHVPFVKRVEYSLVDISADGFCSLMDEEGNVREDVKLPDYPDNFGREIQAAFDAGKTLACSVLSAMGHDQIIAMKEDADK